MSNPSRLLVGALLALLVWVPGCGRQLQETLGLRNQRPVVQLESAFAPQGDAQTLGARLTWRATDPDGRVDHFLLTEDITAYGRTNGWTASAAHEQTLSWRRAARGAVVPVRPEAAFRFFAVKAVDDRGEVSEPAYRVFFDENVAPTVTIVSPRPSSLLAPNVAPDLVIRWTGSDPDGPDGQPAKYKFKLYRNGPAIPWSTWIASPDSFRAAVAPAFTGWDSVGGDSTAIHYSGLEPFQEYLFAITALDAEGAYDPVFSLNKNMLRFRVSAPGTIGPRLTLFNPSFVYAYRSGGLPDPIPASWVIPVLAVPGKPLTLNWYADPMLGSVVSGYRWALDIADVKDESPRRNRNDIRHWSAWDPSTTSVTIDEPMLSKLPVADSHRFYVEALDDFGWRSLGVVEFRFSTPVFDRDLLIVNDTRLAPDQIASGVADSLRAPSGNWPTAAELDTFLFAVGGVRWRMTPNGTVSQAGIFHGYSYDTLGTRTPEIVPTLPYELLSHYRHVVWILDRAASDLSSTGPAVANPMTVLASICQQRTENPLATWVVQGGKLWAVGGGFGNATSRVWNRTANDVAAARVYSSLGDAPDLMPRCFMYDLTHWRSEFWSTSFSAQPRIDRAASAGGMLPPTLRPKLAATDPLPPLRTLAFYLTWFPKGLEYLTRPNEILEHENPSPRHVVPVLDTLMMVSGPQLPGIYTPGGPTSFPVMTLYRGAECGPVTFSGFDLWSWARPDCRQLVDAVLQGQWGLVRETQPVARATVPGGGGPIRR